jgi:hypothetical protein
MSALLLLAAGCSLIGDDGPDPQPTADAFVAAWGAGDQAAMAGLAAEGGREIDLAIRQFQGELQIEATEVEAGSIERSGDEATVPLTVTHTLAGLGPWTYETELTLVRGEDDWEVAWSPAILHPKLVDGRRVARVRETGARAPILARSGQQLAGGPPASRAPLLAPATIGQLTTVDRPGAVELGPTYASGDTVGGSGLEKAYEQELAGQPSGGVQLVEPTGAAVENLVTFEGGAGEPVTTTLDLSIQQAADNAVAASPLPVALVVIDLETGAVRAVANNPPGFDRAFLGEYPPGSTFKIVTATAMLEDGVGPDDPLDCPFETRPGDARPFTNAFDKEGGVVTFEAAFAESCNTTFVNEGFRLGGERLQEQAEQYGFNSGFNPGIPAVVGKFPLPESDTELAASAIGQGRVSVSPLHMASVAAAARTGIWHAPYLVEPTPDLDSELPEGAATELTRFMRAVVEDENGTAPNVAVDGYDVGGKTGTAEFGSEEPPETHAWFVGFVDDLAYAVVVEAGGVGGSVAGPIARAFIESLPVAAADSGGGG